MNISSCCNATATQMTDQENFGKWYCRGCGKWCFPREDRQIECDHLWHMYRWYEGFLLGEKTGDFQVSEVFCQKCLETKRI